MSYVIAAPEMMAATATDLAGIGSALSEAHLAAAAPTVAVIPAAADEVSASIAHLFSSYAQDFHGLAGKAAAFQEQFVQHLTAGAGSYAHAEAANASLLPLNVRADAVVSTLAWFVGEVIPGYLSSFALMPSLQALAALFGAFLLSPLTLWIHYGFLITGSYFFPPPFIG